MKKIHKVILSGAAIATATAGITASALAATNTTPTNNGPQSSLVQKIADTFHLNKADVQKVFDDNRQQHQQDRQQKIKDRLDQAVKDGKITQDQETKLLDELQTLQNQIKNENTADRRANRQQLRTQLEQWAKDNGIDLSQIMPAPPAPQETTN